MRVMLAMMSKFQVVETHGSITNVEDIEEQCSKGTSMHHKWQPIHAFKFKEWLKYLLKNECSSKTLPKQQQQQQRTVEENV